MKWSWSIIKRIHGAAKPFCFYCTHVQLLSRVTNTSWSPWAHPRWASAALSSVCRWCGHTCRSPQWRLETELHKGWRGSNPAASRRTCSSAPRGCWRWSSSPSPPPGWWTSHSGQIWWGQRQRNRLWRQDSETSTSLQYIYFLPPLRCASVPPTTEGAAGVDAHGPHVGLIGVTDAVVEGDDDAGTRTQKTQDQQAQNQGVEGQWGSSNLSQHRKHCRQTQEDWPVRRLMSVLF